MELAHFDLIDDDKICLTNLNRQIIATFDTVGQYKTDVMKESVKLQFNLRQIVINLTKQIRNSYI